MDDLKVCVGIHLADFRAVDKKEYLVIMRDNFLLILCKTICCDPSSEPSG